MFLFPSQTAALMNTCGNERESSHTSLLWAAPKTTSISSTLSWTSTLSPAKPPAPWVLLMNCLNLTTFSTCPMMSPWSSSTHLCKQQSTALMLQQQVALQGFVNFGQSSSTKLEKCSNVSSVKLYMPLASY